MDEPPKVIVAGEAETASTMGLLTDIVTNAVDEQPFNVPVTEYVVVEPGLTTMLAPVCPVLQT